MRGPRKLTSQNKRALARLVANGKTKTAAEATKSKNLEREDEFSHMIVWRALRKQGLRVVKMVKKLKLLRRTKYLGHSGLWNMTVELSKIGSLV